MDQSPRLLRPPRLLRRDESAATSIEYALICAAIGLIILAALNITGQQLVAMLTQLLTAFG
jgi:Flp pilus assembly pilin Flp